MRDGPNRRPWWDGILATRFVGTSLAVLIGGFYALLHNVLGMGTQNAAMLTLVWGMSLLVGWRVLVAWLMKRR